MIVKGGERNEKRDGISWAVGKEKEEARRKKRKKMEAKSAAR